MKTVAFIPGSFKPPHKGHYEMIKHYSIMADEVIVMISNPSDGSKSARKINEKEVSPETAQKLLEWYTADLSNVRVMVSDHPSPVKATYDHIETLRDCKVLLGSSTKDGDDCRWSKIAAYMAEHNPSVTIEVHPVKPSMLDNDMGMELSASGLREFIEKDYVDMFKYYIPGHVNQEIAIRLLQEMA